VGPGRAPGGPAVRSRPAAPASSGPGAILEGQIGRVAVERIAAGGDGVGRWPDGRTAFIPRTAPGDLVEARVVTAKPRYLRAHPVRVLEPGPGRAAPACSHYVADRCGGCRLQHLSYPSQLEAKAAIVGDALRRLGKIDVADPVVRPARGEWGYRSRITLAAEPQGGAMGFHRWDEPASVFDLEKCEIADSTVNRMWSVISDLRELLPEGLRGLEVRSGAEGPGTVALDVGRQSSWNEADALAAELESAGCPASIWRATPGGSPRREGGPPGDEPSFEQVHRTMGSLIVSDAVAALGPAPGDQVWDLYSGAGRGARLIASAGATVVAVERDLPVRLAEWPGVCFVSGMVEDTLAGLDDPDLVLANPPRRGLAQSVCGELLERRPRKVAYVSCDPATLARDLARLSHGYRLTDISAYDLFPQTAHVESLAILEPM